MESFGDRDEEAEEKENASMFHIILPRVLPKTKQDDPIKIGIELMDSMVDSVQSFSESIPRETCQLISNLQRIHQNCTPQYISDLIKRLGPGDTFGMFVQAQHCAIMIHVPRDEPKNNIQNAIVATFPGNVQTSDVYDHESDIEVICLRMDFNKRPKT